MPKHDLCGETWLETGSPECNCENDMTRIELTAELTDEQAMALAQFCKRVGFVDCDNNAVDKEEAYVMLAALDAIRRDLAEKGYAPR